MNATIYKNYEFFPVMKAAAAEKYGDDNYLLEMRDDDGTGAIYPPTHTRVSPAEQNPEFFRVETWTRQDDGFRCGHHIWRAIPNPGWPLTIDFEGRAYALTEVIGEKDAWYGEVEGRFDIRARQTASGLDVWNPVVLAARPFPAILGRNFLEERTLADALAKEGVSAKVTELGDNISRVEYTWQGQPRVAYETVGAGADSWMSKSVVLAEPVVQDERELDWVRRLVEDAEDPRYLKK